MTAATIALSRRLLAAASSAWASGLALPDSDRRLHEAVADLLDTLDGPAGWAFVYAALNVPIDGSVDLLPDTDACRRIRRWVAALGPDDMPAHDDTVAVPKHLVDLLADDVMELVGDMLTDGTSPHPLGTGAVTVASRLLVTLHEHGHHTEVVERVAAAVATTAVAAADTPQQVAGHVLLAVFPDGWRGTTEGRWLTWLAGRFGSAWTVPADSVDLHAA